MKFLFEQSIKDGRYLVRIKVTELEATERENIQKFGSPPISTDPRSIFYKDKIARELPLHDLNNLFAFSTQAEAESFLTTMKGRIRVAVEQLKAQKDDFSKAETYDF